MTTRRPSECNTSHSSALSPVNGDTDQYTRAPVVVDTPEFEAWLESTLAKFATPGPSVSRRLIDILIPIANSTVSIPQNSKSVRQKAATAA